MSHPSQVIRCLKSLHRQAETEKKNASVRLSEANFVKTDAGIVDDLKAAPVQWVKTVWALLRRLETGNVSPLAVQTSAFKLWPAGSSQQPENNPVIEAYVRLLKRYKLQMTVVNRRPKLASSRNFAVFKDRIGPDLFQRLAVLPEAVEPGQLDLAMTLPLVIRYKMITRGNILLAYKELLAEFAASRRTGPKPIDRARPLRRSGHPLKPTAVSVKSSRTQSLPPTPPTVRTRQPSSSPVRRPIPTLVQPVATEYGKQFQEDCLWIYARLDEIATTHKPRYGNIVFTHYPIWCRKRPQIAAQEFQKKVLPYLFDQWEEDRKKRREALINGHLNYQPLVHWLDRGIQHMAHTAGGYSIQRLAADVRVACPEIETYQLAVELVEERIKATRQHTLDSGEGYGLPPDDPSLRREKLFEKWLQEPQTIEPATQLKDRRRDIEMRDRKKMPHRRRGFFSFW